MNFKKIVFCATYATILLGSTPSICKNLKDEMKEENKQPQQESSLKKSFARMIETTTTVGKIVVGATGCFGGIWIWEGLNEYDKHKVSAFIAGALALAGGGGVAFWGVLDILKNIAKNKE